MELVVILFLIAFFVWWKNQNTEAENSSSQSRPLTNERNRPKSGDRNSSNNDYNRPPHVGKFEQLWDADMPLLVIDQVICGNRTKPRQTAFGSHLGRLIVRKSHILFISAGKVTLTSDVDTSHLGAHDLTNEGSLTIPLGAITKFEKACSRFAGEKVYYLSILAQDSFQSQPFSFSLLNRVKNPSVFNFEMERNDEHVFGKCIDAIDYALGRLDLAQSNTNDDKSHQTSEETARERTYLQVLELDWRASTDEIRKAYKELSMVWHPDRHPDWMKDKASQKMKLINEAYEYLIRLHHTN